MKTYFAKSLFVSKTFWVNVALILAAIAEQSDIINVLPGNVGPVLLQTAAVINICLRVFSVRPVAMIAPGDVKAIAVPNAEGGPKPA